MGNRDAAAVEVIISEHRTADGGDEDSVFLNAVMFNGFSDQFVQDTVTASGAVVHIGLDRTGTAFKGIKEHIGTAEFDFFGTHFVYSL